MNQIVLDHDHWADIDVALRTSLREPAKFRWTATAATIDVVKRVTVVNRGPDPDGTWASVTRHADGETISPLALPGLTFRLADYTSPATAEAAAEADENPC